MSTAHKRNSATNNTRRASLNRTSAEANRELTSDELTLRAWQTTYENHRQGRRLDRPDRQRKGQRRLDRDA